MFVLVLETGSKEIGKCCKLMLQQVVKSVEEKLKGRRLENDRDCYSN